MPEPAKSESVPPVMSISPMTKSVAASERVKVRVDDSPALKELSASSSVMAMVGGAVSSLVFLTVVVRNSYSKVNLLMTRDPTRPGWARPPRILRWARAQKTGRFQLVFKSG